jgi:hypothetical protein
VVVIAVVLATNRISQQFSGGANDRLSVENLTISYRTARQWREVVHNVSFTLNGGNAGVCRRIRLRQNDHGAGDHRPAGG